MTNKEKKELAAKRHIVFNGTPLQNLQEMLNKANDAFGDRTAVTEKKDGQVVSYKLSELKAKVDAVGTALLDMGFKGKHIAIVAENSYDWIVAFFAIANGVGVAVPIDKELSDEDISRLISKADCEAAFCSKTYYKTIKKHFANDENFKYGFCFNRESTNEKFLTIDALAQKGKELIKQGNRDFINAQIDREDMTAIFFTSGTTGSNKGVMLSHKNFVTNIEGVLRVIAPEYTSFSLLPMNHVFELCCNIFSAIYMSATIYINDSLRNILPNIQLFKPDAMNAVPLVLEGIYNGIWAASKEKGLEKQLRKLVDISNALRRHGIDARHILFATIRKNFGDKFPTLVCGGAPSRGDYVSGLGDFGFKVYNGYGLTESSPTVTLNMQADKDPTSAGFCLSTTEYKIVEPDEDGIGEIWIRGDNVTKGYYKDEEATRASFQDGWFKTGDYGREGDNHELFVVGRKKNLIILDNGENVFPEDIEFAMMDKIDYIKDSVAIEKIKSIAGKNQKIIAIVLQLDRADFPDMTDEEITEKAKKDIATVNKTLPSYKKVAETIVTFDEFEKNSTRKVIRSKIIEKYA